MIYLGTPYRSSIREVKEERVRKVTLLAARLWSAGLPVFSPVTQGHHMFEQAKDILCKDDELWLRPDLAILSKCGVLIVFKQVGWEHSDGLGREMEQATKQGKPIFFIEDKYTLNDIFVLVQKINTYMNEGVIDG